MTESRCMLALVGKVFVLCWCGQCWPRRDVHVGNELECQQRGVKRTEHSQIWKNSHWKFKWQHTAIITLHFREKILIILLLLTLACLFLTAVATKLSIAYEEATRHICYNKLYFFRNPNVRTVMFNPFWPDFKIEDN